MSFSLDRWIGKVAIVTGASVGIGASICDALVEHGLIVVGVARRAELVEEKAKKLSDKKGQLHAFKADITKEDQMLKMFQWVETTLGHVHVLVNNAGVLKENFLCDGKTEDWRQVFEVNVLALCSVTREAVKIMKENRIDGHIIHINSVAGHKVPSFPGLNVYVASKHAVTALAETLRQEFNNFGLKIKMTSLSPGLVVSEMTTLNKQFSEERMGVLQGQPILQPEDISNGVVYVLSTPPHVHVHELTIVPVGEKF